MIVYVNKIEKHLNSVIKSTLSGNKNFIQILNRAYEETVKEKE